MRTHKQVIVFRYHLSFKWFPKSSSHAEIVMSFLSFEALAKTKNAHQLFSN